MPIDGFDWRTIDNTEIDPDSPLTSTLCAKWRDNQEFLMRWLGRDYRGAAVANHDHDGSNSAPVTLAPNSVTAEQIATVFDNVASGTIVPHDTGAWYSTVITHNAGEITPVDVSFYTVGVGATGAYSSDHTASSFTIWWYASHLNDRFYYSYWWS